MKCEGGQTAARAAAAKGVDDRRLADVRYAAHHKVERLKPPRPQTATITTATATAPAPAPATATATATTLTKIRARCVLLAVVERLLLLALRGIATGGRHIAETVTPDSRFCGLLFLFKKKLRYRGWRSCVLLGVWLWLLVISGCWPWAATAYGQHATMAAAVDKESGSLPSSSLFLLLKKSNAPVPCAPSSAAADRRIVKKQL